MCQYFAIKVRVNVNQQENWPFATRTTAFKAANFVVACQ